LHPGWKKNRIVKIFYGWVMRLALAKMDSLIFVCQADANLGRHPAAVPYRVIHNGVTLDETIPERPRTKPFMLGTVARMEYAKNLGLLIETAKLVEGVEFVIVGNGPDETRVEKLAINVRNVRLAGPTDDAKRTIAGFDAFVLCSRYEGFPYVLLEAAAAGVPIVATDVGGVAELIENELTGLLVKSDDAEGMAAAIRRLRDDPELRMRLAANAREKVAKSFTLDKMLAETIKSYQDL
jgi:glycosyltransferase involved in cell wall biosynthesis